MYKSCFFTKYIFVKKLLFCVKNLFFYKKIYLETPPERGIFFVKNGI